MISARSRLHVGRRAWQRCQAVLLRVARQTPRPLRPCWPVSAEAINLAVGPASDPFRHRYDEAAIQQALDRAEALWCATRPEWVVSAGSLERLLTGARNGLAKCLLKVMSEDRPRGRTDVHVAAIWEVDRASGAHRILRRVAGLSVTKADNRVSLQLVTLPQHCKKRRSVPEACRLLLTGIAAWDRTRRAPHHRTD